MFAILLLASPAVHAWEHIGKVWSEDSLPLEWKMGRQEEDSLNPGYSLQVLQDSWANWHDAECAAISDRWGEDDATGQGRNASDGLITIWWDDPDNETEVGVLGVTYPVSNNTIIKETSSMVYRRLTDADIVFNDNIDFGSVEEIDAACGGQTSIEAVATHEIGHLWGLEHSCQDGDACLEAELQEATMYWAVGPCNTAPADISADDIASITALYGPFGSFYATTARVGASPLSVGFQLESDTPVVGVTWNFGDGGSSTELAPVHEYTVAGQFTVEAAIELEDPICGTSISTYDELGFVLACDAPAPEEGAPGFFTLEHDDGLTWRSVNSTDVSVYGCVDTIAWQVYRGSGESAIAAENLVDLDGNGEGDSVNAWSPKLAFPEAGAYVVVMNVGGPGGLEASFLDIDVADIAAEGSGCTAVNPVTGASWVGLLLAGAAALRRRRSA